MSLPELRLQIDAIDEQLLQLLRTRADLVQNVVQEKQAAGIPTHAAQREAAMFSRLRARAEECQLDPDYIYEVWSVIITHAKEMACAMLGADTPYAQTRPPAGELDSNLRRLTEHIAPSYHEYRTGDASQAVQHYLARECQVLRATIASLPHRGLALDLGCATGQIAETLESSFESVEGYDISPRMIEIARSRRAWPPHVVLAEGNIEEILLQLGSASVSLAVANFGTASELRPQTLFPNLARLLRPEGKALVSFYNAQALSLGWYYPWPSTLHARLNPGNDTIEVWHGAEVFTIPGWGMTERRLQELASSQGLRVTALGAYPTILSILPASFFRSPRFQKTVEIAQTIDNALARAGPCVGTYLLAVLEKPGEERRAVRPGGWGEGTVVPEITGRGFGS